MKKSIIYCLILVTICFSQTPEHYFVPTITQSKVKVLGGSAIYLSKNAANENEFYHRLLPGHFYMADDTRGLHLKPDKAVLLEFDLASIPQGAAIDEVKLYLDIYKEDNDQTQNGDPEFHIYLINQSSGEKWSYTPTEKKPDLDDFQANHLVELVPPFNPNSGLNEISVGDLQIHIEDIVTHKLDHRDQGFLCKIPTPSNQDVFFKYAELRVTYTHDFATYNKKLRLNYIQKATIHEQNEPQMNLITKEISDGLGQAIQTHVMLSDDLEPDPDPDKVDTTQRAIVNAKLLDYTNRSAKEYLPFLSIKPFDYHYEVEALANRFYAQTPEHQFPDADGYAFSSTKYNPDPIGNPKTKGGAGIAFSEDPAEGHPIEMRYLPAFDPGRHSGSGCSADNIVSYYDDNGFLKSDLFGKPKDSIIYTIDSIIYPILECLSQSTEFIYILTIIEQANGGVVQEISDVFGNTIKKMSDPDTDPYNGNEIISYSKYDLAGNVVEVIPPHPDVAPEQSAYNPLGQLVENQTPDKGIIDYTYDLAGRLVKVVNENLRNNNQWLQTEYDSHDRIVAKSVCQDYIVQDKNYKKIIKERTIYDFPERIIQYFQGTVWANHPDPEIIINNLTYCRGRVVAKISYTEDFTGTYVTKLADIANEEYNTAHKILEIFSYDSEGRISFKYKLVPGLPVAKISFEYDMQGKVLKEIQDIADKTVTTDYHYNLRRELVGLSRNGKKFVTYTYNPLGQLVSKTLNPDASNEDHKVTINYKYTIQGWQEEIKAENFFYEWLFYNENVPNPQYNGNISRVATQMMNLSVSMPEYEITDCYYTYDKVNRLTKVHNSTPTHPGESDDFFDASFSYDQNGRFVTKNEGGNNTWGQYAYTSGTNKLESIANSPRERINTSDAIAKNNFIYDSNGNMIFDRHKLMAVSYDWRDLPVLFSFYDRTTGETSQLETEDDIENLQKNPAYSRLFRVKMIYDATGNRVLKTMLKN